MKTINHKLIYLLLLLTIISGCMPDSLTKFNKSSSKTSNTSNGVVVTDDSGTVVTPKTITYPTTFDFYKDTVKINQWNITVGTNYSSGYIDYFVDGSLGDASLFANIFLRCELDKTGSTLSQSLPPGIVLSPSKCSFSGSAPVVYTDASPNLGNPIPYYVRMYFKNAKSFTPGTYGAVTCSTTECYIKSSVIKIGSYKAPANLNYLQTDKLGLELNALATDINAFKADDSNYVTRTDVVSTANKALGSIQFINNTSNILYIQRAIPVTVASTLNFTAGSTVSTFDTFVLDSVSSYAPMDTVTAGSYTGTINYVDTATKTIRVLRSSTSGSTVTTPVAITNGSTAHVITTATLTNPIRGVVLSIDSVNKILRVTQDPNYDTSFSVSDVVTPAATAVTAPGVSLNTTIASIDLTEGIRTTEAIDNDTQFFGTEAVVKNFVAYYPVSTTTNITSIQPILSTNPTLDPANGIVYTIFPELPTGLSLDSSTGIISGKFISELTPTNFTIQATNPLGSATYSFKMSAIYPPKDLSYTRHQLLTISNNVINPQGVIYEGEKIFKSIVTPESESVTGLIRRRFTHPDSSRTEASIFEVETYNGQFTQGSSIDTGAKAYIAERGYISAATTDKIYNYNQVIYVNSVTPFATTGTNSYISNSSNALGRIVYINSTDKALYVQLLTPSATLTSATPPSFKENSSTPEYLCNQASFSGSTCVSDVATPATTAKILAVEGQNYKLTLASGATYTQGKDVTSYSASATTYVGGYIYSKPSTNVALVNEVTRTSSTVDGSNYVTAQSPEFVSAQTIVPSEFYSGGTTTISSVEIDNTFFANRGENFYLAPNLSQGTDVNYSISPALPAGLTIDSQTGVISGKPTYLTPSKIYLVKAKNLLGSTSFRFNLEVRDYFKIIEGSTATSYQFHKVGDTQNNRDCRINAADIKNASGNLDIRCYLDAQEEDIHFNKINFKALVGAGVCEYVQYSPYYFWQFKPSQSTSPSVTYVSGCTGGTTIFDGTYTNDGIGIAANKYTTANPISTNQNYCPGNYNESPNCDEGAFTVVTYTNEINSVTGVCGTTNVATKVVNCGGSKINCLAGPVRDILTDAQLKKNNRALIYSTADGSTVNVTHKAPSDYGDLTNLRVANSSINNACTRSNTDANTWQTYASSTASTTGPYGKTTQFYTFNCLDAAYDIKARIRVSIRDWDSSFKITHYIDQLIPTGSRMNNSSTDAYYDWDDDYSSAASHAAADYSACGTVNTHDYDYPQDDI